MTGIGLLYSVTEHNQFGHAHWGLCRMQGLVRLACWTQKFDGFNGNDEFAHKIEHAGPYSHEHDQDEERIEPLGHVGRPVCLRIWQELKNP